MWKEDKETETCVCVCVVWFVVVLGGFCVGVVCGLLCVFGFCGVCVRAPVVIRYPSMNSRVHIGFDFYCS